MEKRKRNFLLIVILEIFSFNLNFVVSQESPLTCFECGTSANDIKCGYSEGTEKECENNSAGCFIQLIQDSESDIPGYYTKRGCLSDLTEECTSPSCSSCTESNCNNGIYPTDRLSCIKCVDGDCQNGQIEQACGVYVDSADSCVTLFDDGGDVTFKGCYSDIADITKDICNDETQIDCTLCTGENCNTDTTRKGTKCFKCNGLDCFQPKDPEDIVDCLSGCYIGLNENGENVRDCASSITETSDCGSLDEGKTCVVCEGDLCNSAVFPTERLACLTCVGSDCLESNGQSTVCSRAGSSELCATIFAENEDTVIERGCLSTLTNKQVCGDNSENSNCRTCDTKDCNVDSSKAVESKCISCSSDKDPLCILDPTQSEGVSCASECYTKLLEKNATTGIQFIERGCLSSTVVCNEPECEKCTGENCNQQTFPSDRISCYKCEGDACSSSNIPNTLCISYGEDQGCVTFFGDDATVNYKNCYLDAPTATKEICDDSSQLSCSKCTGSNCNSDTTRRGNKCYECEGLECFSPDNPSDVVDCTSDCYVGLNSDGQNIRGCLSDLSDPAFCTEEAKCKSCTGDYCNGIEYPSEGRLECLVCSGMNCEESTESSHCSTFSENEKCVSVFDSTEDTVIARGCSSQVDIKSSCDGSTNCRSCNETNCNNHKSKFDTEVCIKCNSNEDVNCVNAASEIVYCPANVCYSRLLPTTEGDVGQHIERGCATDLASDFECTSPSCEKCSGGKCNSGVFPSDRSKCFKCSDEHCGQPYEEFCFMYTKDVECISVFKTVNETNYKNCYADSPPLTREVCDDDSQIDCVKCSGASCNPTTTTRLGNKCFKCSGLGCLIPNYPADIIDCKANCYVGMNEEGFTVRDCSDKVQNAGECATSVEDTSKKCLICVGDECNALDYPFVTRLTCKSCVGDGCQTDEDKVQVCEKFNQNESCVTIFAETADLVIERGCSSLVAGKSTCDSDSENCLKCSTDECNIQTSKDEIHGCVSCSASDPFCITGSTTSTICKTDQCYSRLVEGSGVERGCMTTEMTCVEPDCEVCQGPNCNNGVFPKDRSSCHFCLNEDCASENTPTKYCENYVKDQNACITFYNREHNAVNYRNCYSDSPNGTQEVCDDETQLDCTKCLGENCNDDTKRRGNICYKCEGLSCFEVNNPADSVDCLYQCYVGLNDNGENIRGCASDFQNLTSCGADDGQHKCQICANDYCNGISFPLNGRLKCHTCLGEDCNNIMDNTQYCSVYDDPCVSVFGSSGSPVERGCLSTLSSKMICDESQYNCVKCDTNACNIQMDPFNIQCVVCDSRTDTNCVINPSLSNQQKCLVGCFMKVDGVNVIRGCAEDLTEECSDDLCKICNETNSCNNEVDFPTPRLSCFKCEGSDCNVSGVDPPKEVCMNYQADDKCVVLFDNYTLSKRACLSDLLDEELTKCSKGDPTCSTCSESNCNTAKIRDDEKCVICNSKDDRYCSTFPQILPPSQCLESGDGKCYTWIDGVDTVRGCISSLLDQSCENKTNCEICEGSGCNKNDFPSDRQACFHCNQTDSDCHKKQEDESKIMSCRNYVQGDTCVEVYQDGIVIERGCGSDNFEICSTDSSACKFYETKGENKNNGVNLKVSFILLLISVLILILRN